MYELCKGEYRMCIPVSRQGAAETEEAAGFGVVGTVAQVGGGGANAWDNGSAGRGGIAAER